MLPAIKSVSHSGVKAECLLLGCWEKLINFELQQPSREAKLAEHASNQNQPPVKDKVIFGAAHRERERDGAQFYGQFDF